MEIEINLVCNQCGHLHKGLEIPPNQHIPAILQLTCNICCNSIKTVLSHKQGKLEARFIQ